jgi:hypothetical protein
LGACLVVEFDDDGAEVGCDLFIVIGRPAIVWVRLRVGRKRAWIGMGMMLLKGGGNIRGDKSETISHFEWWRRAGTGGEWSINVRTMVRAGSGESFSGEMPGGP